MAIKLSNKEKYIHGKLRNKYGWNIANHGRNVFKNGCTVFHEPRNTSGGSDFLEMVIYDVGIRDSLLFDSRDESIVIHIRRNRYNYKDHTRRPAARLDFEELELLYLAAKERRNSIAAHMGEAK